MNEWPFWKVLCVYIFYTLLFNIVNFCIWIFSKKYNVISQKGDTALHIAIRGRSRKLAELLLRNPKDGRLLYRPNKEGETPYNIDCTHQKSILTQIFGASEYFFKQTLFAQ